MKIHVRFLNFIFLPFRLLFSHETVNRFGLRSLRDERYDLVKMNLKGRLIDIGCGNNELVKSYQNDSIGVDVFDFGGGAMIIKDSSHLPFPDSSFDSASFVASLNHVINRDEVLNEVHRLLKDRGRVCLTMLSPFWGVLRHKLAWWDPDQNQRGIKQGEEMGLSSEYIVNLFNNAGFDLIKRERFVLGINNLYIFEKR